MQAVLNHDKKYCEVSSLSDSFQPNSIVEGAKIAEDEKHTISHANTAFLGLDIEVDHLLTKMEKDNLPAEIQKLCSGMQVYKVRYVPTDMSQEEYNSVPFDDENLNTTSLVAADIRKGTDRVKRQITTCSNNKVTSPSRMLFLKYIF